MGNPTTLKDRLKADAITVAPGIYDALTALIAVEAGFSTLYLSGAAQAYTRLGRPDIGLVSMSEVADQLALIRARVDASLVVDADTGYGNALNVQRTVRVFERAGASALQLEDQTFPKRCGHLADKGVISAAEMAGKIKAAVAARARSNNLSTPRKHAVPVESFQRALERAPLPHASGSTHPHYRTAPRIDT
ncbi:MAG: isocitrate lyase/PEP mutase family protein, partial [Salinarimonas sp.]